MAKSDMDTKQRLRAGYGPRVLACAFAFTLIGQSIPLAHGGEGSGEGGQSDDEDNDFEKDSSDGGDDSDGGEESGGEGGSDDDDSDAADNDGGESGSSDDGESGSGDGEDGGSSGGESGGSSGGEGGEGGSRHGSNSGSSSNVERGHAIAEREGEDQGFSVSRNEQGERIREGEVFLVSSSADVSSRVERKGLRIIEDFRLESVGLRVLRVEVPAGRTEQSVIDVLQAADPRGLVSFNHVYSPAGVSSAATKTSRAALNAKRMSGKIGLVDAGVDARHPMLRDVSVTTRPFGTASQQVEQHGTAVASRIAEAAPGASILAANVFTRMPGGEEIASADAIARGMDWLAQMKVPVINLSLAGPANPILESMAVRLIAKGHVLVAAVGNEGPQAPPQYPAAYDNVVGVTAVDTKHRVYLYANQGAYVDFAAPGVDAEVANPGGASDTASGTSYAAPIVAAAFARLVDRPDKAQADAAMKTLSGRARDLGKPGRDPVYGHGLIVMDR